MKEETGGYILMVAVIALEVLRSNFWQFFEKSKMVQKVSGRVQEGPRSPPDPIKHILMFRKIFIFETYFLLPTVLPIVLPIALPIVLPIVFQILKS